MPSKSAGTSRQQNGLLQPPSAIDTDDAAADATAQPADLMELAGCAKFHRGKWDMELLQAHAQNKSLMTEAEAAVLQLTPEMLSFGRDLLRGLQEPVITLSLALCTSRRGAGGRTTEPDPFSNPRMDPTAAQRVANKRRTAAFSKFKSKVAGLAEAAAKAGLLPGKASGASHTGALASGNSAATEAAAASAAAAAETAVPIYSCCSLDRSLESSSPSAAAADNWGRPGNSPFRRNSVPAGTAAAGADAEAPAASAASAAGVDVAGEEILMQVDLMQQVLFCEAANQQKKRPPQRAQTHRVLQQPQPRHCVKRHKSQQLLGSAASTEVANADGSSFECQQQGVLASQVLGMSGPYTPSASRFGAACGQLASAQLCTVRTINAGSPAAGPGCAGFTDVYTQLALADAADAAAEAAVHSQQRQLPHCGRWQHQAQGGKQSCAAAGGPAHAASGPQPVLFDLPVQQVEATAGSNGFDDDAWLLEDFDILGSPSLADLLLANSPAASPRAGSWDWPQLPGPPDLAQAPKDSLTPAQHSSAAAQHASAAVLDAIGAGAGPVTATPAAGLPGQQQAAAHVLANAPQTPAHFRLGLHEVSAAAAGLPAAGHYGDAVAAMQGHHLGASGLPGYASTGTATAGPAQQAMLGCPAPGAQHAGLSAAQPGYQGAGPARAGPSTGAGHPAASRGSSHVAAAAAAYGPAGAASGLGTVGIQSAVYGKRAQNSSTCAPNFGVRGGRNCMAMPVLARRSSPAALSPMGSASYACGSTDMLSPTRRPPARHASTADLRQSARGAPAGRQLQELQEVVSVGCMHEQLAMASNGLHAGLPCMPHGMPSTAGGHHGSALAMGLPPGQPLRPWASWNGPVLAGANSSSSPCALQDGTKAQHMAHQHTYGPSTGRTAAPAAVWPLARRSSLQSLQQAAVAGHEGPAAAAAPNAGAPQAQPEPAYSATAQLMGFVADVLRASNGHMATAANGILPVLAAAAAQGHTVAPALKQLQIALLEMQLQQHQAQLLGMMGAAVAGPGEAANDRETSAIASTLSAVTEMGLETANCVHSGISYFAQGAPLPSAHQAGVPLSEVFNPTALPAGAGMQLGDAAYLASVPDVAPDAIMAGRSGGFFGKPGM